MASVNQVLEKLGNAADPSRLEGMARYGMDVEQRMGVKVPDLRRIAKETGKDHALALELWQTGIAEARIVAAMVDVPSEVTEEQMDEWAVGFNSWDVCDQVCMNLFDKTPLAWRKVQEWAEREEEFVKRAAFALVACLAWHDKEASDEEFIDLLPVIVGGAEDERNYVKKGVSWALRMIGKRNPPLNQAALKTAHLLKTSDFKSARWIGSDAVRDLTSESTKKKMAKFN